MITSPAKKHACRHHGAAKWRAAQAYQTPNSTIATAHSTSATPCHGSNASSTAQPEDESGAIVSPKSESCCQ